jgi:general secretion pathway protein G
MSIRKSQHSPLSRTRKHAAFTLIELLVVVVILGIVAAIVLPQFSNASASARAVTLKDDLRFLRNQALTYKVLHLDVAPGYDNGLPTGNASAPSFVAQMTLYTDDKGNTSATQTVTYKNGPYLQRIPFNPINGKDTMLVLQNGEAIPADATDTYGWIYQAETMTFLSDAAGVDENGAKFFSY